MTGLALAFRGVDAKSRKRSPSLAGFDVEACKITSTPSGPRTHHEAFFGGERGEKRQSTLKAQVPKELTNESITVLISPLRNSEGVRAENFALAQILPKPGNRASSWELAPIPIKRDLDRIMTAFVNSCFSTCRLQDCSHWSI